MKEHIQSGSGCGWIGHQRVGRCSPTRTRFRADARVRGANAPLSSGLCFGLAQFLIFLRGSLAWSESSQKGKEHKDASWVAGDGRARGCEASRRVLGLQVRLFFPSFPFFFHLTALIVRSWIVLGCAYASVMRCWIDAWCASREWSLSLDFRVFCLLKGSSIVGQAQSDSFFPP